MPSNTGQPDTPISSGNIWKFANCEFHESSRELRVNGTAVDLESKPLDILQQLLLHAGEVVTKEELLDSVWPGVSVVDGSVATAVSKLRKVVGDDPPIVVTVPRIGYRLGVAVQCRRSPVPFQQDLGFKAGDPVPGRDQWQLLRKLDASEASEVWVGEHPKTREARVFKFAADGLRLRGLKREVTLARFLKESLGERPDLVRVLEWNFEQAPFFVESEYAGPNLIEWAEKRGGLDQIPLTERLRVLADISRTVAAAHEVGVLHKDLKPANILMASVGGGEQPKVGDFGSGSLTDPVRLHDLGITNLGFTQTQAGDGGLLSGTVLYLAPEVFAGHLPTVSADVYALGVMLYQMAVGDFRKPLAPGWETEIDDPLLREDIAIAACGDPARRLNSAAVLAERLEGLDGRRSERDELELARERAELSERRLAQARLRRPWAIAAALALAAGAITSLVLYGNAARERDRANHQTMIAEAVNEFLATDLLGRSDPFQSSASDETLLAAVKRASPQIDDQFRNAPEVAAQLHQTIAVALDNRSDFAAALPEYERAATLFDQTGLAEDAIAVRLREAAMEARSYQKDAVAKARSIIAREEARMGSFNPPRADLRVWLASARGMLGLIDNNAKVATEQFQSACGLANDLPNFDEHARLTLEQKLAFSYIRAGDGVHAEKLIRKLIAAFSRVHGPDSANVLRVRLNLAQAFMIQNKHREAIEETSTIYPAYVARLGETHELSMQVLATRAESEASLGMWAESIRDDLKIHQLAVEKQGPMSFYAIATLSDAALAECRAGRYKEGELHARSAYESSVKGFGPRAGITGGTRYTLASCQIGLGQLDEASRLLGEIDSAAVAQLAGVKDWSANVDLALAEIAFRRGQMSVAKKHLAVADPVFSRPDAEAYQKRAMETLRVSVEGRK